MPFGVVRPLAFMAEKAFGAVITFGVRVCALTRTLPACGGDPIMLNKKGVTKMSNILGIAITIFLIVLFLEKIFELLIVIFPVIFGLLSVIFPVILAIAVVIVTVIILYNVFS
jgi:hypothetical protein